MEVVFFFFSSRRRHTRSDRDWSSDVCSSDLLRPVARPRRHVREYRHGLVDMVDRTATDGLLRSRRCALGLRAGRSSDGVESLGGGGVMLSAMKSTPSATPWLRTAIVTALFVIGLAILWI